MWHCTMTLSLLDITPPPLPLKSQVGVSLGASILTKYVAEAGQTLEGSGLVAAVSVSARHRPSLDERQLLDKTSQRQ